eukprot:m.11311 g.11311  ORF g.11311 m.11311 type:complete len:716 (+) comp4418_c0_seq2:292-2439(+)
MNLYLFLNSNCVRLNEGMDEPLVAPPVSLCRKVTVQVSAALLVIVTVGPLIYGLQSLGSWKIFGSSFSNWVVVLVASAISWLPSTIIAKLLLFVVSFFLRQYRNNQTRVTLKSFYGATVWLTWSCLQFAVVYGVFTWNPFPLGTGQSGDGDLSDDTNLSKINLVLLVHALLTFCKRIFLVQYVAKAKRTEFVEAKAMESLQHERALNALASDVNPSVFKRKSFENLKYDDVLHPQKLQAGRLLHRFFRDRVKKKPSDKRQSDDSKQFEGEPMSPTPSVDVVNDIPTKTNETILEQERAVDISVKERVESDCETNPLNTKSSISSARLSTVFKRGDGHVVLPMKPSVPEKPSTSVTPHTEKQGVSQLAPGMLEYLESNFIGVNNNSLILKTSQDAKNLGTILYILYSNGNISKDGGVQTKGLQELYEGNEDVQMAIKEIFSVSGSATLSKADMEGGVVEMYKRRKYLGLSLKDLDSTVKAIGSFIRVFILISVMILLLIMFSDGDTAQLTVTASTSIFALSFMFADTAKNLFNSFVFLFIRHPFDVGDRVAMDSMDSDHMYVSRMELLTTTFRMWNGYVVTIPNHVLYQRTIFSIGRAGPMSDVIKTKLSIRTTTAQLKALEDDFLSMVRQQPDDYVADDCEMLLRDLVDANSIVVVFVIQNKTNWQNSQHIPRKQAVIYAIKESCERNKISYVETPKAIHILSEDTTPRGRVAEI